MIGFLEYRHSASLLGSLFEGRFSQGMFGNEAAFLSSLLILYLH
jgi:hypothetical protein